MITKDDLARFGTVEICEEANNQLHIRITTGFDSNAMNTFELMKLISDKDVDKKYPCILKAKSDKNLFDYTLVPKKDKPTTPPPVKTFDGREVIDSKTFVVPGTFEAMYAAQAWIKSKGYDYGSTCARMPVAVMKGDYYSYGLPHKWKNFSKFQKNNVHGQMVGEMREGPVTVYLFKIKTL